MIWIILSATISLVGFSEGSFLIGIMFLISSILLYRLET